MIAVFILKNGAWEQVGDALLDCPANVATLKREAAYLVNSLGVTAEVFRKKGN